MVIYQDPGPCVSWTGQQVCGGCVKPILVFSLSFDQAEQNESHQHSELGHCVGVGDGSEWWNNIVIDLYMNELEEMDKTIVAEAKQTKKHAFKNIVEKMDMKEHIEEDRKAPVEIADGPIQGLEVHGQVIQIS